MAHYFLLLLLLNLTGIGSASTIHSPPGVADHARREPRADGDATVGDILKLKPIRAGDGSSRPARDLSLKDKLSVEWRDSDTLASATLNVDLTASEFEDYKVINMDDFTGVLDKIDCSAPSMALDFASKEAYINAKKSWEWVDKTESHTLILFANHPDCGSADRLPFKVSSIRYDDADFVAHLSVEEIEDIEKDIPATELELETFIEVQEADDQLYDPIDQDTEFDPDTVSSDTADHDIGDKDDGTSIEYDSSEPSNINIERRGRRLDRRSLRPILTKAAGKRAWSIQPSISLNHNFNGNIFSANSGDGELRLDCVECGTRGYIRAKVYVRTYWFSLKQAYIEFKSDNVKAFFDLRLEANAAKSANKQWPIVRISPFNVGIPKIIELGLSSDIGVGGIIDFRAQGAVEFGVTAAMSNGYYRKCFKGCSSGRSGWDWSLEKHPLRHEAEVGVHIDVHAYVNPKAALKLFGKSLYEGGVAVLAPRWEGDVAVTHNSQGGLCNNPQVQNALTVEMSYGYKIFAYVGQSYVDTDWSQTFLEKSWTFYEMCTPLDDDDGSDGGEPPSAGECETLKNVNFNLGSKPWRANVYGDDTGRVIGVNLKRLLVWDTAIETSRINIGLGQEFTRCPSSNNVTVKVTARKHTDGEGNIQFGLVPVGDHVTPVWQASIRGLTSAWKTYTLVMNYPDAYKAGSNKYLLNWYTHKPDTSNADKLRPVVRLDRVEIV